MYLIGIKLKSILSRYLLENVMAFSILLMTLTHN